MLYFKLFCMHPLIPFTAVSVEIADGSNFEAQTTSFPELRFYNFIDIIKLL